MMQNMDILEEEVAFSHDILSEKHRRTRNNNEQKWRKDRNLFNRYTKKARLTWSFLLL